MRVLLVLIAFHPSAEDVAQLRTCLAQLSDGIGYAVVANAYRPGEPVDQLRDGAAFFLTTDQNLGYGRAFNRALQQLNQQREAPDWVAALNTDLSWAPGTMEQLLSWLEAHDDVVMAVPQIVSRSGERQYLCKRDPSVLAMLSRRFWPERWKPAWLRHLDGRYTMVDHDYQQVFDVPYLSGCCMLMRRAAVQVVRGFDERFFLYLEDADLTRRMRVLGRCVHLPVAAVTHGWGRGSHRSFRLTLVNLHSMWLYFRRWGLRWW